MRQRSKYHSRKVTTPDGVFDSQKEWRRYCELILQQENGQISELQRQVSFELIPSIRINGKVAERACTYKADFVYMRDGEKVVEDVKGFKTETYKIKRKLLLWRLGIQITEV